jgi:dihydropteroate synthase
MKIGHRDFDFYTNIYIMGILNATPDSFSDGGHFLDLEDAKKQVAKMITEGADIIDIGGESTRPGHEEVSAKEEIKRVIPMIEMIKTHFDTVISIDTSKAEVAEAAIKAGAHMVNDIWGLKKDPNMAKVIAKYDVPCCIMHNREKGGYKDLIIDIVRDLASSIEIAYASGVKREQIIIDPGIGFAKTLEENLKVMGELRVFNHLGYPLLLGTSRKSMIGHTLDVPVDERVEGTLVTTVLGVQAGAAIFRVHDVLENKRAIDMTMAIMKAGE